MLHKPSVEEEEGAEGIRGGWLNQRFNQFTLELFVLSFLHVGFVDVVQHVGRRSQMCGCSP